MEARMEPTLDDRLDAVIDAAIAENRIVGTVVFVSERGETVYARAAGHADRDAGKAVAENTIFRFASVTKPIVAATALALIDTGKLALDAPVTDWLDYFTPPLPDGRRSSITIGQLLTHTAGLSYRTDATDAAGVAGGLQDDNLTLDENIRRLAAVPLIYEPGTQWSYSLAIDVVGAVIEAAEGATLGEAVERYVTGPLGMRDTRFGVSDPERLSLPYADAEPRPEPMGEPHVVVNEMGERLTFSPKRIFNPRAVQSGGAGMAGTAPDFMAFLNSIRGGGAPILSPEITAQAMHNQIGTIERPGAPGEGFCLLGALITDPAVARTPLSPGSVQWGGVYGLSWFIDPVRDVAVDAFTNTAIAGVNGRFPDDVRAAVYG